MKSIFNVHLILFFFLIISTNSWSQVYRHKDKESRYSGLNLKDSVKSVRFIYTKYKEGLSVYDQSRIYLENDIRTDSYLEFTETGDIAAKTMFLKEIDQIINKDSLDEYIYNDETITTKTKYIVYSPYILPVYYDGVLKPDVIKFSKFQYRNQQTFFRYEIKNDKIIVEKKYSNFTSDSIFRDESDESFLVYKMLYLYDKNILSEQKIIPGQKGKRVGSIAIMGTQAPYCDDTGLQYSYDAKWRITKAVVFSCKKIVASEEYTYHPSENYITTLKRYIADPSLSSYPSKNMIAEYNEYGDITHMHFVIENDTSPPQKKIGIEPLDRYYEYDYDNHNNWIRCRLYLMGDRDEPTVIAERKIEYYNDKKNRVCQIK